MKKTEQKKEKEKKSEFIILTFFSIIVFIILIMIIIGLFTKDSNYLVIGVAGFLTIGYLLQFNRIKFNENYNLVQQILLIIGVMSIIKYLGENIIISDSNKIIEPFIVLFVFYLFYEAILNYMIIGEKNEKK